MTGTLKASYTKTTLDPFPQNAWDTTTYACSGTQGFTAQPRGLGSFSSPGGYFPAAMRRRGPRFVLLGLVAALVAAVVAATGAHADPPPPGSMWTQHYINEPDGTQLHADVLRPASLPADAKTPVILSIGPYFNHSGQTGPAVPSRTRRSTRSRPTGPPTASTTSSTARSCSSSGYTWVQVDLRGFGGSSGCLDWAGPGEQADVKAAVEWAASQPWSTGKVGMYGKSYDGVTGLIGIVAAAEGPGRGRRPGARLRPLPLPLHEPRPVRELARSPRRSTTRSPARPGAGRRPTPDYNFNALNDTARPAARR